MAWQTVILRNFVGIESLGETNYAFCEVRGYYKVVSPLVLVSEKIIVFRGNQVNETALPSLRVHIFLAKNK